MNTTRSKAINLTFINLSDNHIQGLIPLSLASLDRISYLGRKFFDRKSQRNIFYQMDEFGVPSAATQ